VSRLGHTVRRQIAHSSARRLLWRIACDSTTPMTPTPTEHSALPRFRRWVRPAVIALVLADAALLGVLTIQGFATPGAHAAQVHQLTSLDSASPRVSGVFDALQRDGLGASLAALEAAAVADSAVLRDAHQLAHALGRQALVVNGGDASVISQCRPIFASGCYHGVVEAFLEARGQVDMVELERMCSAAGSPERPGPTSECIHGLGHGVLGALALDLTRTLEHCDALSRPDLRRWCHSGAFMEAISAALADSAHGIAHHHGAHAGEHGAHGGRGSDGPAGMLAIDSSDPYSPCDAFDGPHASACWVYQGFLILQRHDFQAAPALKACDGAPGSRAADCYQSIGLQLTGLYQRDDGWVIAQCAAGSPALAPHCAAGAVLTLAAMDWSGARAARFCEASPPSWKAACYRNTGRALLGFASVRERAELCGRIEPEFGNACRDAAALGVAGAAAVN
jgi:hypothetical protein